MNLGLVHPYINHLNTFILVLFILSFLTSFIKSDSLFLSVCLIISNYIAVVSVSILNSIFIIFLFSAEYLINRDLAVSVGMIALYTYLANSFIKMWSLFFNDLKIKNYFLLKLPTIAIIIPFIIAFLICYYFFNGDKIYKLSPHCENTQDPKIKVCKYSNGTYTGEMKAFRRHGQGEYIWNSGKTYSGEWKSGKELK
jgi:hypothetical protein